MPRAIEICASPNKIDTILQRLEAVEGIVNIARQPGISLSPPGDVLSVYVTNEATRQVMEIVDDLDLTGDGAMRSSPTPGVCRTPYFRGFKTSIKSRCMVIGNNPPVFAPCVWRGYCHWLTGQRLFSSQEGYS